MTLTDGTLLGGRVVYRQPSTGYRTGIEPVLLAASVTARPGERVVEGGTGAGAAMLCVSARLPGVVVTGIERDAQLVAIARDNLAANGFARATAECGSILDLAPEPRFDHAIANPPWHDAASTASPSSGRDAAKRAGPGLLVDWCTRLAGALQSGGSLTLLLPASSAGPALEALAGAKCGGANLMPLWPRAGQEARLLLVRAIRLGRGPSRILPGLVLHDGDGFSAPARAILWDGAALPWHG